MCAEQKSRIKCCARPRQLLQQPASRYQVPLGSALECSPTPPALYSKLSRPTNEAGRGIPGMMGLSKLSRLEAACRSCASIAGVF
jgi:hypothetical protein